MFNLVQKATDTGKTMPFSLTKEEKQMLDPNYKVPKRKVRALIT